MCGLISTLLVVLFFGFGFFGISSSVTEPVGGFEPTMIAITAEPLSATPTPAPNEIVSICPPVTKSDTEVAATMIGDVFDGDGWGLTVTELDDRTQFTWRNDVDFGMAYLELLHFDCGYIGSDIMSYYTDDGWDTILQVYDSYEETAQCGLQGLRLFEFDLVYNGFDYQMRYWIEPVTEQRVGNFSLVFLGDDETQLDAYANLLYPELASCEES